MRLEGFLSLLACIVLLGVLIYGLDALYAHLHPRVTPVESSAPP